MWWPFMGGIESWIGQRRNQEKNKKQIGIQTKRIKNTSMTFGNQFQEKNL